MEADKRGLVFVNPRPNYGRADTLESALEEKQFRVKNMVRPVRRLLLNGERRLRENETVEPGYGREGSTAVAIFLRISHEELSTSHPETEF